MYSKSNTLKNISYVSISNIIVLIAGVLVGFLLPKIVGVTDYGYYKTYTLYATYIGMFHFGITDGIYLKYGGFDYSSLDRDRFLFYTKAFSVIEFSIAVFILFMSLALAKGEYRFVFSFLAAYLLFHNITGYYQGISQATSRFVELSSRNVIQSVLICIAVITLWIIKCFFVPLATYKTYIVLYTIIIAILTIWYVYTYRDISVGKYRAALWKDIPRFIKIGFPLMLANLCSSLILTLDRQFVNILFNKETYAVYAFAYNMLSLVTTATSAVSMVLYPKLKQTDKDTLKTQYDVLVSAITCVVFFSLIVYFPLGIFVNWFLPKYSESLNIFRIIFPGLAVSSAITIVMHNYYKTLGINFSFFIKSIIALVVSGIANYIAYVLFKTTTAISVASIITILFWYILVEAYFIRNYHIKWIKNLAYLFIMMISFYLITCINNLVIAAVIYGIVCVLISYVFNKQTLKLFLGRLKKSK